jgi:hypothetical protein
MWEGFIPIIGGGEAALRMGPLRLGSGKSGPDSTVPLIMTIGKAWAKLELLGLVLPYGIDSLGSLVVMTP